MSLILLDQNTPLALRRYLTGHDVRPARLMGWSQLGNGDLIHAAEQTGFDILITADQNIRYQQNLVGRRLSLVVLSTNRWDTLRPAVAQIIKAVTDLKIGAYLELSFERPPRRRRPHTPKQES